MIEENKYTIAGLLIGLTLGGAGALAVGLAPLAPLIIATAAFTGAAYGQMEDMNAARKKLYAQRYPVKFFKTSPK